MSKKDNYIMYNGERLNLADWVTPAEKCKDYEGKTESYVRKLVWNNRQQFTGRKQIDYREIPELGLTLVKK